MSGFHSASLGPASTTSVVWCVRAWLSYCESGSGVHDQHGLVRPGLAFILRVWVRRPRSAWSGASGPGFHSASLGPASTTSVVWCVRAWLSYCESGSGVHDQRGLVRPGPAFILRVWVWRLRPAWSGASGPGFHTTSLGPASTTSVVWCVRAWLSYCESGSGVHDQRGLVRPGLAFILRVWVRRPRPAWSGASGPGFHTASLGPASTTSVVWCVRAWLSFCESGSGVHDQRGLVRPGPAFILRVWVWRLRPAWSGEPGPGFHTASLGPASTTSVVWCVRAWISYWRPGSFTTPRYMQPEETAYAGALTSSRITIFNIIKGMFYLSNTLNYVLNVPMI